MEYEDFCRIFELAPADRLALKPRWNELLEKRRENSLPPFLNLSCFRELYPLCDGAFPMEQLLDRTEKIIALAKNSPAIALLAHIASCGAFELQKPFYFSDMPDPIPLLGKEFSGMFSMLISLGAYRHIVRAYAECGVPETYARDMMKWIGGTMYAYATAHDNIPGRPFKFNWLRNYIDKILFRIGRLEFLMHPYPDWLPAIYRDSYGHIAALAKENWKFRSPEYRAGDTETAVFVSHLYENENTVTGTPIPPNGILDFSKSLTLNKKEWNAVASPWDICPSVHIPGGKRMPWEEVKQSLIDAKEFFIRYFHRRIPLVCCSSWILNPAWETELENSNIVKFRHQGYAFPCPPAGNCAGQSFVFGRSDVPPDQLPAVNAAQKAMQRCYRKGCCGAGALFILADDMEKLGSDYYRNSQ